MSNPTVIVLGKTEGKLPELLLDVVKQLLTYHQQKQLAMTLLAQVLGDGFMEETKGYYHGRLLFMAALRKDMREEGLEEILAAMASQHVFK